MDVPNIKKRSENIQKTSEKHPKTSEKYPKNIRTKNYAINIQKHPKNIRKHPKNIQKTSEKHPKKIPKRIMGYFLGCGIPFCIVFNTYVASYSIISLFYLFCYFLCWLEIFPHGEIYRNNYIRLQIANNVIINYLTSFLLTFFSFISCTYASSFCIYNYSWGKT